VAWEHESNQAFALYGSSASSAGDTNGDGFSDLLVGAVHFDNGQADEGRVELYYGSASGPASAPDWSWEAGVAGAQLGGSVSSAGDTNGDGFGDVILGAYAWSNGEFNEGAAFVFLGSGSGLGSSPAWSAESAQATALMGGSVSGAGDTNGDGFADVLVGAVHYDNGSLDEGRVWLFAGSASGPSATPAWTAESDQVSALFGSSVSGAGDVNGDGYSDVLAGAYYYDNGEDSEGGAFLYLGSASGPGTVAAWTAEGDQAGAEFGAHVSGAGDVNGDGLGDAIVGAPSYSAGETDEGAVFFCTTAPPRSPASLQAGAPTPTSPSRSSVVRSPERAT
jgi:hypothetical protein